MGLSPTRALRHARSQRGITLIGLLFWAVIIASVALVALKVLPTLNEYFTIQRAVNKIAKEGGTTVPEIRAAFERQKQIEYSISSIEGKDLDITKENEKIVVKFAYDKEIELIEPVFLLIKYRGHSQ
jgi:Tfp pilus assembly major pilin PilA